MSENISFLPAYDFSPETNAEMLRKILPQMMQFNVPINPINYAIWYEYVSGNNAKLNYTLDELLKQQKSIDSDTSFSLYKNYVCNTSMETLEKVNQGLQNIFADVTHSIKATHHKTVECDQNFQKNSTLLENFSTQPDLQLILTDIIQETKSLSVTSQLMQAKLNQANQEIEALRKELNQVRTLALTDGLTGLLNRRAFNEILDQQIETNTNKDLYLALLDIDHFKRINDTHGHTVGDHILKYIATLLKKHTDAHYHTARYGGEEMAIIMPASSKEKAYGVTENIRNALEKSLLKRKDNGGSIGKITISIGITAIQANDDAESFIRRADKALYTAKETGRNKVVFAD